MLNLKLNLNQFVCFGICLLLMLIVPITQQHKIIGINIEKSEGKDEVKTIEVASDGTITVNTTDIGKNITGYGGTTPVEITIKDDRIQKITPLPNRETPEFFGAVRNSYLIDSFEGKTLEEASSLKVDAVSGATFSSNAVIQNIKAGVEYALDPDHIPQTSSHDNQKIDAKWIITIIVILLGGIVPFFITDRRYRTAQLILNTLVLGLWGGTFISYSIMVSALTNGLWRVIFIPTGLLLIMAFVYPMFGKINHYCNWLCPYGSIQELAGKCWKKKIKISGASLKLLTVFRQVLWVGLMWLLLTGLWFDWMGYEPFAAFFFNDASWVVLGIAIAFLILSFFVQRPYCRFVCPTGTLFKFSEGSN